MKWLVIVCLVLFGFTAHADNVGTGIFGDGKKVSAGCSYTGPGDKGSADAYYALRAYSAATCGNGVLNVCNTVAGSDVLCEEFVTSASTGAIIPGTFSGQSCSVLTCTVKIIRDITGNNKCNGSCDLIQATPNNRFTYVTNCGDGNPCLSSNAATQGYSNLTSGSGYTVVTAQPMLISGYAQNVSASYSSTLGVTYCSFGMYFSSTNDVLFLYGGNVITVGAAHGSFHSIASIFNGASGSVNVDASVTGSQNFGAGSCSSSVGPQMFGGNTTGYWRESGFFASSSTTLRDALQVNMTNYW